MLPLFSNSRELENRVDYRLKISHPDAHIFTAVAVVACVLQYLSGEISHPGLYFMGHAVDPARLIQDMKNMGAKVESSLKCDTKN